jgi:hypothetical protein
MKKALQLASTIAIGALTVAGVCWIVVQRPGFLPQLFDERGLRGWHISFGYRALLGLNALIASWAIGWMIVSAPGRASRHLGPLRDSLAVWPPRLALAGLCFLQLILPVLHRPEATPALVLTEVQSKFVAGAWEWVVFFGGNVASLAFLLCCAAVALWYLSGAFGDEWAKRPGPPLAAAKEARAKQALRVCLEVVCGFSVLLVVPIALDTLARALRPPVLLFQDGALSKLRYYLVSPTHLVWPAYALSVAAISWALGWGLVAVAWRLGRLGTGSVRRAEEEVRRRVGKKLLV